MTTDPALFRALAERARKATESDRDLDAAVARALGLSALSLGGDIPAYSASLDAVIRDVMPAA